MRTRPHPVEEAASFLQSSSAPPKEKLVVGGKLLWAARVFSNEWTPPLLDRAKTACKFLFDQGTMAKTIQQMDEKAVSRCLQQFTNDVTELAADIVRARQALPRKS